MPEFSLEPLHRFHTYCARFPSEIVEEALEKYTKPGDSVFDPFCGSGTTLVASLVISASLRIERATKTQYEEDRVQELHHYCGFIYKLPIQSLGNLECAG